jgi:hypothetical protein
MKVPSNESDWKIGNSLVKSVQYLTALVTQNEIEATEEELNQWYKLYNGMLHELIDFRDDAVKRIREANPDANQGQSEEH